MTNAEKALELARSQLGTKELPANSNNVKYNTWYYGKPVSGSAYPWCMAFVQWCYARAGAKLPYLTASCGALLRWYKQNDPACVVAEPRPGDIVIFDLPGGSDTDHTGLFESEANGMVTSIDGNTGTTSDANGGAVMRRTRSRKYVAAYIRPRETAERKEEPMTGEEIYKALSEYLAQQGAPNWARGELAEAIELGITDGKSPMTFVPRYQAAIMAKRAAKRADGK